MTARIVKSVVPTHTVLEGGGFKVRRPVAMGSLMSPFLLLDEMGPVHYGPGEAVGAPSHPHRGFETVTYILQGSMQHADSAGNSGDLNTGDVQWMTAGKGIIHSELPHPDFLESGGVMHGFQIWVNLPAKDKMMNPRYQDISSEQLPVVRSPDGKVWAKVVAGEAMGAKAIIDTVIPIQFIHYKMEKDSSLIHEISANLNAMIYLFGGEINIDGKIVGDGDLIILGSGDNVEINSQEGAEFLILAGPEINEPIARYGPFVMNTREEIHQAIFDFQNGNLA
jgi:redox-sensitive bicupin YhaK (pirin superfamily)